MTTSNGDFFKKTGCLFTASNSDNNKINLEDLPDYKVPPPILLDPSTGLAEQPSIPENDSEVEENVFDDFIYEDEMDDTAIVEDDKLSSDAWIFDSFNL